jgi:hypothetical protein
LQEASFYLKEGVVNQAAVFKVAISPPKTFGVRLSTLLKGDTKSAVQKMQALWKSGYAANDIVGLLQSCQGSSGYAGRTQAGVLEGDWLHAYTYFDGVVLQLLGLIAGTFSKCHETKD